MSDKAIQQDIKKLNNMKRCIDKVSAKHGVPSSVIGAIASRESRAGRLLEKSNGYGDGGRGYGIMQCDVKTSGLSFPCTDHKWNSCDHIEAMVEHKLVPDIQRVADKHPTWSKEQQLQGAVAAYNFGVSNVQTWDYLDRGTTGNNYSSDVMARAKCLRDKHGWK